MSRAVARNLMRAATTAGVLILGTLPLSAFESTRAVWSQHGQQQDAGGSRQPDEAPVFRGGVARVAVTASVRTRQGRIVPNLTMADFQLIDTGFGRPIQEVHTGTAPISLAVLLDISGSMGVGGNMDRARHAVGVAMTHLHDARDEAALFTFDSALQQVVEFTRDLDRVRRVSLAGMPWGQTSLFDAIAETAHAVAGRDNRHRAVLVITDGVDTGSRLSAAEVSAVASAIDVPVYLLRVANPLDHVETKPHVEIARPRNAERATLADLAHWTGGDMRTVSQPSHTVKELHDLFTEVRHLYLIVFEPGPRPGWHPIEIRTPKRNYVVHARGGYVTVPPPSGS